MSITCQICEREFEARHENDTVCDRCTENIYQEQYIHEMEERERLERLYPYDEGGFSDGFPTE